MWLLKKVAKGNKEIATFCLGISIGAVLAIGVAGNWHRGHVAYNTSSHAIQRVFQVAGAAWILWALFLPNKGTSWRLLLGWLEIDGPKEWFLFGAYIVASFALLFGLTKYGFW